MVSPFYKRGVDFMECQPPSSGVDRYIIITIDYFTKWDEAMPTFKNIE
jgi:hypothetical protein